MIHTEKIGKKLFVTQTTYYVYDSKSEQTNDDPSTITSDQSIFDTLRELEKGRNERSE